jgi:hypothetical protein
MSALGLEFERTVRAQPSEVRRAVATALRDAGFEVTAEQLTRVEAKRGSKWLGGALMPARMLPILAVLEIGGTAAGCTVAGHLTDQHINLGGKAWGWNQSYRQLFGEVVTAIDRALGRLDAAAVAGFAPSRFWTKGGEIVALEQVQTIGAHAGASVFDKAGEILEGGPRQRGPAAWKGVDSVAIIGEKGWAVLAMDETQAHLGVAVLISGEPGALPGNLRADVEDFAGRLEGALSTAGGRAITLQLEPAEEPVFAFLHQQARIRDGLPVRSLHVCRTCHFEKITNEDLERLQTRNMRLRTITGSVGAIVGSGGVSVSVLLGSLFRLKKLDPDYICPRCQGMDDNESLVTFCPKCGDLRREAVLRVCGKCKYDFRDGLEAETLWLTQEAAAAVLAPPTPAHTGGGGWGAAPAPAVVQGGWGTPPMPAPAGSGGWGPGGPPAGSHGGWGTTSTPAPAGSGGWGAAPPSTPPAAGGAWIATPPAPGPPASPAASPPAAAPVVSPTLPPDWPSVASSGTPASLPPAVEPAVEAVTGVASIDGAAAAVAFCPFCGTPIGPAYAFCPSCGGRIDPTYWGAGGPTP